MDRIIAQFPASPDRDLMFCAAHGIAYQRVVEPTVAYDQAYYEKCAAYDPVIAARVNDARIALVARHHTGRVLDVGAGAGHFVARRPETFGYDVNPATVAQLQRVGLYDDDFAAFGAFTFWDVLEHVARPQEYFDRIGIGAVVFVSLPIFSNLMAVRSSKHYRPGEHLYYFTHVGFVAWMERYGFALLEASDHEQAAGRDSITAFAFRRVTNGETACR